MNLKSTHLLCVVLALAAGVSSPAQLTAKNAMAKLSPGINLGNTLEAIPEATSWGNPVPTEAYMKAVRKAGFRSIRIPAAWTQYSDADHNISDKWMSHVYNVVTMATKADLYVLLNVHWDGGWMQSTYAAQPKANAKLRKFWTQIATKFRNAGEKVMFAGTNETGVDGVYGPPKPENAEVQNGYNQVFVDAVRATGGKNRNRFLVVQGYNTSIEDAVKFNAVLPKDSAKNRLMMEVHYYSPYNFTLNEKSNIWQWGATATDPAATETWANEAYCDREFKTMTTTFVEKGVPVILGEYCCGFKPNFPGMRKYQLLWDEYVTQSSVKHGMVPMLWDTGSLFNRTTGEVQDKELLQVLIAAARPAKRS